MESKFAKFFKIDSIIGNLQGYIDTKIQLLKLEAQQKITKLLSVLGMVAVIGFFAGLVLILLSIGIAALLNEWWDTLWIGYFAVAGFYLLIMIILAYSFKKGGMHKLIKKNVASMFNVDLSQNGRK